MKTLLLFTLGLLTTVASTQAAAFTNGGFESGLAGWKPLWTREPQAGTLSLDSQTVHRGKNAARIEHHGEQDWSLEPELRLSAKPGDLVELEAWVKIQGAGSASLCVSTVDHQGKVLAWSLGERTARGPRDWYRLQTRFLLPEGVEQVQPRLVGSGPATIWLDDFSIQKLTNSFTQRRDLAESFTVSNANLQITVGSRDGTIAVTDRQAKRRWSQRPLAPEFLVSDAEASPDRVRLKLLHITSGLEATAIIQLDPERQREFTLTLNATGELSSVFKFPAPFASSSGDHLVVPMNEGISYPVEDKSIEPMRLVAYGGHGICMAFWGVTDGAAGHMAIIETPDDATIHIDRLDGKLAIAPEWEAQKGQFGYARRLRYIFFPEGGHVAMCKRYRDYAREIGLLKTLAQKREFNPNVDLLIGAVNVWCWDSNPLPLVREMKAAGIERILWSNRQSPENLRALNELGLLTSRYDIYQDVMDPANFKNLRGQHSDWTTAAWPKDIVIGADGNWLRGWAVKGKDDQWYSCGVTCDRRAVDYARQRVPAELATHPYGCRFIDTTTAAPWHECYQPDHPMTRGESRHWKMELLRYMSEDMKLVTGCETGHDASVPFLHYFEGMLSLGPYRVPDSGRDIQRVWTDVPERVAKFQMGHRYRLPLWELVYHDCVVAQWYWGDYNNKLPALWDKRDLFNLLYATPPMFMFNRESWEKNKDRFARSYQTICPTVRALGYSEMTGHRFLTTNRDVQQTAFADGTTITVNFGSTPFALNATTTIPSMAAKVLPAPAR